MRRDAGARQVGSCVERLQRRLNELGLNCGNQLSADGVFGTTTEDRVFASYNPMTNFPGWPVRRAVDMWRWAHDNDGVKSRFCSQKVSRSDPKIGDLMFFKTTAEPVGHVGFYAGNGEMLDVLQPGDTVRVHSIGDLDLVDSFRILGIRTV